VGTEYCISYSKHDKRQAHESRYDMYDSLGDTHDNESWSNWGSSLIPNVNNQRIWREGKLYLGGERRVGVASVEGKDVIGEGWNREWD